ncbi:hypothetical protein [Botryobacter ruber]|uniref:hypothetical protein n=1 Tax=Botryobacter ruber TaxID=2171629 RepID=UPI001F0C7938|nr:hypothetical protein [Botryobacter ruber]
MPLFLTLLPLYFSLLFTQPDTFRLAQDMEQDLKLLRNSQYFISDNASLAPSLQTVENDLQLFKIVANTSLTNGTYSSTKHGNHQVNKWEFDDGEIQAIFQIETTVQLDTVIMQRYLENRPPTPQKINNTFTFRTYAVATKSNPQKLLYITEADQGLLTYILDHRKVEIIYSKQKEGLSAVFPGFVEEIEQLVSSLQKKP